MDRIVRAVSRFRGAFATAALAVALAQPFAATAQTTSGDPGNGATLYLANCNLGCHGATPLAVFASTANAANAGGHLEWTRLNGMPAPPLTAAQFNDIAAYIAQSVPDPSPTGVAAPFNPATPLASSAAIAIPNIFLGTAFGQYAANLQFVSASKGTASFSGTSATYTASACQTGTDTVSFRATRTGGASNTRTFTVAIAAPPAPAITSPASANATTGAAFSYAVTVAACPSLVAGYTLSGNPAWLGINAATGVVSGTPPLSAAGTTVDFVVGATYAGGASGTLAVSLRVALGAPVITSSPIAPSGAVGAAYAGYLITATNAPTGFAATGLPPGLSLDVTTGLVSGTPTAGGTFTAGVTASNAAGTSAPQGVSFSIVLNVPVVNSPPTASGQTGVAFAYQITATNGPPFTGFAAAPLPAGLALDASAGLISGTPTVPGSTSVIVTASNAAGPSAPFSLAITITQGPPVITSPATAVATVGSPFAYQITATNNPTSFGATGLPPGLVIDAATGLVSGTPTASGTYSVALSATNAVPLTGTRSLTIAVSSLDPFITSPAAASGETGAPFTFRITAANNPTGFRASGLPPGLVLDTATGVISGIPTAGGTFAVTLTALNATGSSSQVLTINIAFVAPPVRDLDIEVGFQTTTVIDLPVGGLFTRVNILTQPEHGTLTGPEPGASSVTYQPATGYSGPDGFTWSATGPGGTSATARVGITIPAFRPVVAAVALTVPLNTPTRLDLRPFITGSGVTGVSIARQAVHGSVAVDGTSVVYTPRKDYFGSDTFRYVAFGNAGRSEPGEASVTVIGRPDPTRDAAVTGILAAQARTARRMSEAQIANIQRRLESLHAEPSAGDSATPEGAASPAEDPFATPPAPGSGTPGGKAGPPGAPAVMPAAIANAVVSAVSSRSVDVTSSTGGEGRSGSPPGTHAWIGGLAQFGAQGAGDGAANLRFSTDGLTVGADRRVSERLALGLGVGYARDRTDVGADGSNSRASAVSVSAYASFQPTRSTFVDALLGYGSLDFEADRFVTAIEEFAAARRKGRQLFGSIAGGYAWRSQGLVFSPYARIDLSADRLQRSTESGAGPYALAYQDQTLRHARLAAGLRLETRTETDYGWAVPRLRIEMRHDFEGGEAASLGYADQWENRTFTVTPPRSGRNALLVGVGSDFVLRGGLRLGVDYQGSRASGPGTTQAIRFMLSQDLDGRRWTSPWSWPWSSIFDRVGVEAGLTFDDNVGRGRAASEKFSDQVYHLGIQAGRLFEIGDHARFIATALLDVDKFRDRTGLGRTAAGVQGEALYRASGDFDEITYGLFARAWLDGYESRWRSGHRLSAGLSARSSLTDRIEWYGEAGVNGRRARSAVFGGRDVAAKLNIDYSLPGRGILYLAGEYRRGDTFSSGLASLENINSAEVLVPDDAFEDGSLFAYRARASMRLGTLGFNRPLGPRDSIDFSIRRVHATPLHRTENSGSSAYTVNQYSLLYLMRF